MRQNAHSPHAFLRFFAFLKPHTALIFIAAFAGLARYLIPLSVPWGVKVIIDDILSQTPDGAASLGRIHLIAGSLIGLYFLWSVLGFVRLYLTGLVGNRIIFNLRSELFSHIQRMSLGFFERQKIGKVVSRMTADIGTAQQLVGNGIITALMDGGCVAIIALLLLRVHWQLAFISFSLIPFYLLVSRVYSKKMRYSSREVQKSLESLTGNLFEKLSGISLIQTYSREKEEELLFFKEASSHLDAANQNVVEQAWGLTLTGFLASIAPLLVIWYGALCVTKGTLSVGELVAFYAYVGLLFAPVTRLTELSVIISGSLAAIERIFEFFEEAPEVLDRPGAAPLKKAGKISFCDVTFSYLPSSPVLKNFSVEIQEGEFVILSGVSGCGKSTLFKLLMRFYDVEQGSIQIEGQNIREMTVSSLRSAIGLVLQEPILFNGTILENILYGKPDASWQEVVSAARTAHVEEFVTQFPGQFQTPVGERGVKLSLGQRQRIALARVFLKNPSVLLLDEPTAALDLSSQSKVLDALHRLRKGKTTLLISHDPLMMKGADRVLDFQKGLDATVIPSEVEGLPRG